MGCGDLMNPLTTAINSSPAQKLEIHVNDSSLPIIARNILIVKIISAQHFEPSSERDMDYLWDVWYNATWPETTLKRFIEDVKSLLNGPAPANTFIPEGSHQEALKKVWSQWLAMIESTTVESVLADRYKKYIFPFLSPTHVYLNFHHYQVCFRDSRRKSVMDLVPQQTTTKF